MIEKYIKLVSFNNFLELFYRIAKIASVQFLKISLDIICLYQDSAKQIFRNFASNFLIFIPLSNI